LPLPLEQTGRYCRYFKIGEGLVIPKAGWPTANFVIPLQKEYHVEFENDLIREVKVVIRKKNTIAGKGETTFSPFFLIKDLKPLPLEKTSSWCLMAIKCCSFSGTRKKNLHSSRNFSPSIRNSYNPRVLRVWLYAAAMY
jgi:hypothetical protein